MHSTETSCQSISRNSTNNYYSEHLAEVNNSNAVMTSENIYNIRGALVLSEGKNLSKAMSKKIRQHKLLKPLELSVSLEHSFNVEMLLNFLNTIKLHPELRPIFNHQPLFEKFVNQSGKLTKYPLIMQKLTVLAECYPKIYETSILGAFTCLILCEELSLDDEMTHITFVAACTRDLGLLHIDPEVVNKKGRFTANEWQLLQGHVAIGYHFLTLVPNLPKEVPIAVLEHHERSDGFGYPLQKLGHTLSCEGQIVAFVDQLTGLFKKYVLGSGYASRAMIPLIQINSGIHNHENAQATIRFLNQHFKPFQRRNTDDDMLQLINRLVEVQPYIVSWFDSACEFNSEISAKYPLKSVTRSTKMITRIISILQTSGANDDMLLSWLKNLDLSKASTAEKIEVEQFSLMLQEVVWQFNQLAKMFNSILEEIEASKDELDILIQTNEILEEILTHVQLKLD